MLYLIRPTETADWVDLPNHFVDLAVEYGDLDLAVLDWKPTEALRFHPTVVRLALRHGVPCSKGIVVRGTDLVPFTWLVELLELKPVRTQDLPSEDLMELLVPGWKQHSRELDERVAASLVAKVEEGREELEDELTKPVVQGLVDHWQKLGARLPEPV